MAAAVLAGLVWRERLTADVLIDFGNVPTVDGHQAGVWLRCSDTTGPDGLVVRTGPEVGVDDVELTVQGARELIEMLTRAVAVFDG